MQNHNIFTTAGGFSFPGISCEQTRELRGQLFSKLNLHSIHITEAASYSLAMVARFALGLSADRADVCVIANKTLSGTVALATLRHLTNAGSKSKLIVFGDISAEYPAFDHELSILKSMQIDVEYIENDDLTLQNADKLNKILEESHNLILGLFDLNNYKRHVYKNLISILNEARTPIHCIDCPLGIDADSGAPSDTPLFASSTLSLGTVLSGLYNGNTYTGRQYLCDISLNKELYNLASLDLAPLFSEQPVIKISASIPEDDDE